MAAEILLKAEHDILIWLLLLSVKIIFTECYRITVLCHMNSDMMDSPIDLDLQFPQTYVEIEVDGSVAETDDGQIIGIEVIESSVGNDELVKEEYEVLENDYSKKRKVQSPLKNYKNVDKIAESLTKNLFHKKTRKRGRKSTPQSLSEVINSQSLTLIDKSSDKQCKKCGKIFSVRTSLEQHLKLFHGESKPYECHQCKMKFIRKVDLNKHYLVHQVKAAHKCNVCGKKFSKINALTNHLSIHKELKEFNCEVCQRKFKTHSALKRHFHTHTDSKDYECKICKRKFLWPWHLKSHIRTHSGAKDYKCEICQKNFTKPSDVKRHMLIHSNIKQFECEVCGKKFTQAGHVKSHEETHTNDRKFECELCGSKFLRSANLKRHMLTHTNLKPHKCDVCSKCFSLRHHLKRHLLLH
ncbi:uncharacterized protein LOC120338691 [Styela clava]